MSFEVDTWSIGPLVSSYRLLSLVVRLSRPRASRKYIMILVSSLMCSLVLYNLNLPFPGASAIINTSFHLTRMSH